MALGAISGAYPRTVVVDFSIPHILSDTGALIHIPRELSKWAALMRPYQNNVWIPVMVTLLLAGPVGFFISKVDRSNTKKYSLSSIYETAFKIFVQQGPQIFIKYISYFKGYWGRGLVL